MPTRNIREQNDVSIIPCLFIRDQYDFVVPPAIGMDAYDRVSSVNKKFILLTKSGYSGFVGEWQLSAAEIINLIDTYK